MSGKEYRKIKERKIKGKTFGRQYYAEKVYKGNYRQRGA